MDDNEAQVKAVQWIEEMTGLVLENGFPDGLKDGVIICA